MICKFRIILDNTEDIFRDIAIKNTATLEDLHNTIVNSFGFDGTEVGSFYTCTDDWEQEDEIPQFDMGENPGEQSIMADFILKDILDKENTRIIYVYDFFNMWTFFVELAAIEKEDPKESYPTTLFALGEIPESNDFEINEAAVKHKNDDDDFYTDNYLEDDDDDISDYDEMDFENNWN